MENPELASALALRTKRNMAAEPQIRYALRMYLCAAFRDKLQSVAQINDHTDQLDRISVTILSDNTAEVKHLGRDGGVHQAGFKADSLRALVETMNAALLATTQVKPVDYQKSAQMVKAQVQAMETSDAIKTGDFGLRGR